MTRRPESKATAETVIAGVTLRMHILDDGRRVIEKEGVDAIMAMMESGELTEADAIACIEWHRKALAQ